MGYAQIFESLRMKNFTPATSLVVAPNTFIFELRDCANVYVALLTKRLNTQL